MKSLNEFQRGGKRELIFCEKDANGLWDPKAASPRTSDGSASHPYLGVSLGAAAPLGVAAPVVKKR
jgi:hypothetical protein